ncbi:alpha/beta fold hydrolase [Mesorhizobium sp.]|uniref:alpha/beta fold hydrolase n=1 Tax=Mesorhizobium sp. TaxID=1871066 RepID=UPI0025DDEAF9|nr:alpha/beta fold hydrolase [Mesorhizobium sp.]
MLIEHQSKRPNMDPTAYVSPTAVICGDVAIGPRTHISFGAVIEAHGAPVRIGAPGSTTSAAYFARWQPPALMVWGRHDPFFDLAEILSWMQALPRMEAHVFDAGHKLLETHAAAAAPLMLDFIRHTQRESERAGERE